VLHSSSEQTVYRGEHITLKQALSLVGVGPRDKKKHNYRLLPARVSDRMWPPHAAVSKAHALIGGYQ